MAAVWSMFLSDERGIMSSGHSLVFETERLAIRTATKEDVELLYALWTNPQVMRSVGFPHGLRVTRRKLWESQPPLG